MSSATPFYLGRVEINPLEHTLVCDEQTISLQPKFIEVLAFMAEQQPELLTRQQIIDHVWDGNYYVGEKALTNAIWHLRKAFKELDAELDYIETVRKSGYRLLITPEYREQQKPDLLKVSPLQLKRGVIIFTFLFSIFLAWQWWPEQQQKAYQTPELLTQYPGRELFPSVSNDGHYLVYSWRQMDRQIDLFVKDLQQPDLPHKNITHSVGSESRSVWSADDSELFYYRRNRDGCQITGMNMSDFTVKQYGQCARSGSSDVATSKDGKLLAYIGVDAENTSRGVYIKQLDSEQPAKRLRCKNCIQGEGEAIDFSPDGTRIAISRNLENGNEDIFIYDLATDTEQRVVTSVPDIRGLAWHPTENKIVYAAVLHGNRHGFELDLTTQELLDLNVEGFSYPAFDNSENLYFHDWKIDTSIMRVELDTEVAASPFPLIQSEFNFRFPDYSSTANKLAFISNESGYDEVWLSSLDGAERKQLTQLKFHSQSPVWSGDGKQIAFTANNGQESRLYVINVLTGQLSQIQSELNYYTKPRWSTDNSALYSVYDGDVYRIDITSGVSRKITDGAHAVEIANNQLVVYKSGSGLWQVNVEGERIEESQLVDNIALASSTGWHVTEQGIYYFKVRGHDYRLSFYDFTTKQDKDLLRVPERSFSRSRGMSFIPEKQWLLFTGYESPQVDIKRMRKDYN